jgi:hypothetical protein
MVGAALIVFTLTRPDKFILLNDDTAQITDDSIA